MFYLIFIRCFKLFGKFIVLKYYSTSADNRVYGTIPGVGGGAKELYRLITFVTSMVFGIDEATGGAVSKAVRTPPSKVSAGRAMEFGMLY